MAIKTTMLNRVKSASQGRRRFLATSAAGIVAFFAAPALALTQDAATKFAQQAFGDLIQIGAARSESGVRRFLQTYGDMPTVARAVLGAPWRGLSSDQQAAYSSAFEGYIVRKYTGMLKFIDGSSAQIVRIRDAGRGGIVVSADFTGPGGDGRVDLQIADVGGAPKVIDLKVAGISLVGTERQRVRSMLGEVGNDTDQLIARLNAAT